MEKRNIYKVEGIEGASNEELFEDILRNPDILIERIVSTGQVTPAGEWYDQLKDEWVLLLTGSARILFENEEIIELNTGDYILIPAHCRHRVEWTSTVPECIWLAIHGNLTSYLSEH